MRNITNLDRISFGAKEIAAHYNLINSSELKYSKKFPFEEFGKLVEKIINDYYKHQIIKIDDFEFSQNLIRGFTYCFDIGIEIAYFKINKLPYKILSKKYDFDNLYNGISGDKIDINIQIKVNNIIPTVGEFFYKLVAFYEEIQKINPENIPLHEAYYMFLSMAGLLGFEYCFELIKSNS